MSEPKAPESESESTPEQAVPRSNTALLVRITALLFVAAVIGAECLLASLFLPAASETASAAASTADRESKIAQAKKNKKDNKETKSKKDKQSSESRQATGQQSAEEPEPDALDQVEIDLEPFSVTAHQPASNTTVRIEFHLYGVINDSDKDEFARLLKANQYRLRDQVLVIVRSAEERDLADPGLGLIKRQILEKTNALLGKPLLRAVVVSDFSYIEQ